jgi:hypothetical protein
MQQKGIKKILSELMEHPSRIIDWVQTILLGLCLTITIWGVGGNLAYGKNLSTSGLFVMLLSVVHSLFWLFRRDRLNLNRLSLLPIPFLILAFIQGMFTPVPWTGMLIFATYLQAYVIFFICLHSFRSQKDVFHLLGVMVFIHVLALCGAFFEMYFYPMWYPGVGLHRTTEVADYAAGFFHSPERLGAFLLILLPFMIIGSVLKRFPGPIRMLLGFFALATCLGIFLTVSRPAILCLFALAVLIPLFVQEKWRKRKQWYLYEILAIAVILPLVWFLTDTMRASLQEVISGGLTFVNEGTTKLMGEFFKNPLLGHGLGSLNQVLDQSGAPSQRVLDPEAFSGYLSFAIELGALGLVFLLAPIFYLLFKGFVEWKSLPFLKLTLEEESRARKAGGSRARRKKRKSMGRSPSGKIVLGGILLGWLLFLFVQFGYNINGSALIIFYSAVGLSVLIFQLPTRSTSIRQHRWLVIIGACIPMVISVIAYRISAPLSLAQYFTLLGDTNLEEIENKGSVLFREPSRLFDIENDYSFALKLVPEHGGALEGLSRAQLARLDTGLFSEKEVGSLAMDTLDKAIKFNEGSWRVNYDMAKAMELVDADSGAILKFIDQAIAYGPLHAEPLILKADILMSQSADTKIPRQLIEEALHIDPQNEEAIRIINRINLNQL